MPLHPFEITSDGMALGDPISDEHVLGEASGLQGITPPLQIRAEDAARRRRRA